MSVALICAAQIASTRTPRSHSPHSFFSLSLSLDGCTAKRIYYIYSAHCQNRKSNKNVGKTIARHSLCVSWKIHSYAIGTTITRSFSPHIYQCRTRTRREQSVIWQKYLPVQVCDSYFRGVSFARVNVQHPL